MTGAGTPLLALVPEGVLVVAAAGGLLLGVLLPRRRQWVVGVLAAAAAVVGLVAAAVPAVAGPLPGPAVHGYVVDAGTAAARVVALGGVLVVVGLSGQVRGHPREAEFHVLVLLGALGAVTLAGAEDLLVVAVAYLLASVPLYALTGFARDAPGTEAALKYYLMGALLGVLLLAGVTLLLGAGGATGYGQLSAGLEQAPRRLATVAALAVLAGLLFKAGAVPAHFWVPDVVQGARPVVAAFVTTVPKAGALVAVLRLGERALGGAGPEWVLVVALVAAASMTLGNLAAFFQSDVRRLLAYSTVSQVGYLLMAATATGGRSDLALPALAFYLGAYALANLGAFAVVCALPRARRIGDYAGLFRRHRWLALSLVVCLLSLVGTPPTGVFLGKVLVFGAALDAGMGWLMVLAAANTVASLFYYLRWVLPLFARAPRESAGAAGPGPPVRPAAALATTLAALALASGVAAGPVLSLLSGATLAG